jgi:hypothetical protein
MFKQNCLLKFEPEFISLDHAHRTVKIQNMQIPCTAHFRLKLRYVGTPQVCVICKQSGHTLSAERGKINQLPALRILPQGMLRFGGLLGFDTIWCHTLIPMFWSNMLPVLSGLKELGFDKMGTLRGMRPIRTMRKV